MPPAMVDAAVLEQPKVERSSGQKRKVNTPTASALLCWCMLWLCGFLNGCRGVEQRWAQADGGHATHTLRDTRACRRKP